MPPALKTTEDREAALRQVLNAALVAVVSGAIASILHSDASGNAAVSDFDHLYAASRAFLGGKDPYALVGPSKPIPWPYPLYYPLPALLFMAPFTLLPRQVANSLFVGFGCGAMWYGAERARIAFVGMLFSAAFLFNVQLGQWSAWMMAGALLPSLGWVLCAKPTIGAAMWFYGWRVRAIVLSSLLVVLSFVVRPSWVVSWWSAIHGAGMHPVPLVQLGGPLVLLALLRWRRPEARLLVALAAVPQTISMHEALALFLVCRSRREAVALASLTWLASVLLVPLKSAHTSPSFVTGGDQFIRETMAVTGPLHVALLYLPCLLMVLRRPNEGAVPQWLERMLAPLESGLAHRLGALSRRIGLTIESRGADPADASTPTG